MMMMSLGFAAACFARQKQRPPARFRRLIDHQVLYKHHAQGKHDDKHKGL